MIADFLDLSAVKDRPTGVRHEALDGFFGFGALMFVAAMPQLYLD